MNHTIVDVRAYHLSHRFRLPPRPQSRGSAVKRDMVLVKLTSSEGVVGYGESYHGHAPTTVADFVNTTLREAVLGEDVHDVEGISFKVYMRYLIGAGLGAAVLHALSGLDMALWDVRGKALGVPAYTLLGGRRREFRAYAGGLNLGFQPPEELIDEIERLRESHGFTAVKLRLGDTVENDLLRVERVREHFGGDLEIMGDANLGYTYSEVYRLLPGLADNAVTWLEEPLTRDNIDGYADMRRRSGVPIAAGENLYGRLELKHWLGRRALDVVQSDCSKTGGVTELKKIGDLAATHQLRFAPHTSHTRLNHAATLHVMSALPSSYVYEADASHDNQFHEELITAELDVVGGLVRPPSKPGLGVTVNEDLLDRFAGIGGAAYAVDRRPR
ncbi:mandelate racemase/muconate lactonizing enzyme family protein [Jiangella asiatica]|uniref:mandelate racemase/muconate lactonizing enzyme family protein n=1 Tax=Jiangella asiatica TaxID=2530372 RepID=UPI0013A5EE5B|nr:mandelate racemase/muconate lactonizing enzyme family protein [Jiangella asiatica]